MGLEVQAQAHLGSKLSVHKCRVALGEMLTIHTWVIPTEAQSLEAGNLGTGGGRSISWWLATVCRVLFSCVSCLLPADTEGVALGDVSLCAVVATPLATRGTLGVLQTSYTERHRLVGDSEGSARRP